MNHVPEHLARTIVEVFGEAGVAWLDRLPVLLADCERRWSLTVLPPEAELSYNYVAPTVHADGAEMILKVGVPNKELLTEMAALRLYDGRGMVRLLDADAEWGALLLERLRPGTPLWTVGDDEVATSLAAEVMRQLRQPVLGGHSFPTVAGWAAGLRRLRDHFEGGTGPFPAALVEKAEGLFAELLASMEEPVLLHGDLHHDNILAAQRQPWLAIDPKGVVGEPAFEVGALLRNRLGPRQAAGEWRRLLTRRVDQLSEELELDRRRVVGWGVAQAVLSGWWSFEDHGYGWEPALTVAEHLAELLT